MNRGQRRLHAWTWTLLAIVVGGVTLGALMVRERTNEAMRVWTAKAGPR